MENIAVLSQTPKRQLNLLNKVMGNNEVQTQPNLKQTEAEVTAWSKTSESK
jgi:hypothetical protein